MEINEEQRRVVSPLSRHRQNEAIHLTEQHLEQAHLLVPPRLPVIHAPPQQPPQPPQPPRPAVEPPPAINEEAEVADPVPPMQQLAPLLHREVASEPVIVRTRQIPLNSHAATHLPRAPDATMVARAVKVMKIGHTTVIEHTATYISQARSFLRPAAEQV